MDLNVKVTLSLSLQGAANSRDIPVKGAAVCLITPPHMGEVEGGGGRDRQRSVDFTWPPLSWRRPSMAGGEGEADYK